MNRDDNNKLDNEEIADATSTDPFLRALAYDFGVDVDIDKSKAVELYNEDWKVLFKR